MEERIKFLSKLPKRGTVAEIGVAEGAFSEWILKITKPHELYLIDCWEHQKSPEYLSDPNNVSQRGQTRRYRLVKSKFRAFKNVKVHKGYSLSVVKHFPDYFFDWLYLDANHTYEAVKEDLEAWYPKVRKNGIIAGHDYTNKPYFPMGVIAAVDEFIKKHNMEMFLIDSDPWHSWALRASTGNTYFGVEFARYIARNAYFEKIPNIVRFIRAKINKIPAQIVPKCFL